MGARPPAPPPLASAGAGGTQLTIPDSPGHFGTNGHPSPARSAASRQLQISVILIGKVNFTTHEIDIQSARSHGNIKVQLHRKYTHLKTFVKF